MADFGWREAFPDLAVEIGRLFKASTTGDTVARLIEDGYQSSDLRPRLAEVEMPVLVLHHMDNPLTPVGVAQEMAGLIPGARFVPLPGRAPWIVEEGTLDAINGFLQEGTPTRPGDSDGWSGIGMRAVLFTDLVNHAEMMTRLGDDKGRDILRDRERIIREILKMHDGTEIKTMGDGFMASFSSVNKAAASAIALQRAFAQRNASSLEPVNVRVGLNAGEPIAEEDDLFGASVILAARVASYAEPGQILLPEPVRHLLAGKGFMFSDYGEVLPKGFEDPVRLFELRWDPEPPSS